MSGVEVPQLEGLRVTVDELHLRSVAEGYLEGFPLMEDVRASAKVLADELGAPLRLQAFPVPAVAREMKRFDREREVVRAWLGALGGTMIGARVTLRDDEARVRTAAVVWFAHQPWHAGVEELLAEGVGKMTFRTTPQPRPCVRYDDAGSPTAGATTADGHAG